MSNFDYDTPMGSVNRFQVDYGVNKPKSYITEFDMSDDGYDLMSNANGDTDFYDRASGNQTTISGGDDFFNASDDPDNYMPDGSGADGEDYDSADGEEYSNLTIWSKSKRKKFGKQLQKGIDKAKASLGKVGALAGSFLPQDQQGESTEVGSSTASPTVNIKAGEGRSQSRTTEKKGMSTGMKVGIAVGVIALGGLVWYLTKKKN